MEGKAMKKVIRSRLREYVYHRSLEIGKSISQAEIAEATQIRQPTISAWMDNKKPLARIDVDVLLALSGWAGCDPLEMLRSDEVPEKRTSLTA